MEVMLELILLVDGAGGGHSTAIISDNGGMGCTSIIWNVELWLIVSSLMGRIISESCPQLSRKGLRSHVADHLEEKEKGGGYRVK